MQDVAAVGLLLTFTVQTRSNSVPYFCSQGHTEYWKLGCCERSSFLTCCDETTTLCADSDARVVSCWFVRSVWAL